MCRTVERPLHVYSKAPHGSAYSSTTLYYHGFPYILTHSQFAMYSCLRDHLHYLNKFDPRLSFAIEYSSDFVLFYLFNKLKREKSLNLSSAIIIRNSCNIYRTSINRETMHWRMLILIKNPSFKPCGLSAKLMVAMKHLSIFTCPFGSATSCSPPALPSERDSHALALQEE